MQSSLINSLKQTVSDIGLFFKTVLNKLHRLGFKRILKYFLILDLALFIIMISVSLIYRQIHKDDPVRLGVSFSTKAARELGVDYKDAFKHTVDELGFERLRVMSYWNEHEKVNDEYDFTDLDWQFEQAEERGVLLDLALGLKQPRWPECHAPEWTEGLSQEDFNSELLEYTEVVVERYKDSPVLNRYQLENEAKNHLFADCPIMSNDFLTEEHELVKRLDPDTPTSFSVSNQSGVPLFGPIGDFVGFSIYDVAWLDVTEDRGFYWRFWYVPSHWHSFRAAMTELLNSDSDSFVHELQTEPWGPEATQYLSIEEQDKSMSAVKIPKMVDKATSTGMKEVYLWGAEWWYWRLIDFDDSTPSDSVKSLIQSN